MESRITTRESSERSSRRMTANYELRIKNPIFILVFFIFYLLFFNLGFAASAAVQDEIANRQQQIDDIQKQIDEYQRQIDANSSQAKTLESEIKNLNANISQIELTIRSLELSINQTSDDISDTESKISDAEDKISKHKDAIAQYLKLTYESDQKTLTEILLANNNLSDFFTAINDVRVNQEKLKITIDDIKKVKSDLEDEQAKLEDKKSDYEKSRNLEAMERSNLGNVKKDKDKILKVTKGQEKKFQELVAKSQKDIDALRSEITYLEQNGVTAEEAIKFGNLAALHTGIRPAFLIAVLEVESGLGRNVGKCNRPEDPPEKHWQTIMHSRDLQPFQTITSQLGMDTNNTAVSCPQYLNGRQYGYGGAMGPAQFIPSTWLTYADIVTSIVGRPANPWTIEDAFTASAVKLARAGATAQTRAAEIAASKAYYSGKSNCSSSPCNSYASAIQRKAAEIQQNL